MSYPARRAAVTLRAHGASQRSINGALAGAIAAGVWAAQQPLDKRVFGIALRRRRAARQARHPRRRAGRPPGLALHLANGAAFGAVYAQRAPVPARARRWPPAVGRGARRALRLLAARRLVDRYHPARGELPTLAGNRRAFAQAIWRHAALRRVLGELERRLNAEDEEPPPVPVSSNGHGNIEHAAVGASVASSTQLDRRAGVAQLAEHRLVSGRPSVRVRPPALNARDAGVSAGRRPSRRACTSC